MKQTLSMISSANKQTFIKRILFCLFALPSSLSALDLNADGMSDVWQRVHNIADGDTSSDHDGDGQNNRMEAIAGSNPRDLNDFLTLLEHPHPRSAQRAFTWRSVHEKSYQMEQSFDLRTWNPAGNITRGQSGLITTAAFNLGVPLNDSFASRLPASNSSTQSLGSNLNATAEPGEPIQPPVSGRKTVWWSWSSATSGTVTITTAGSNFDTTLAIYSGTEFSNLVLIGANDDFGGHLSSVTFTAQAGVSYSIQVNSYGSVAGGSIVLNHPISSGVIPPSTIPPTFFSEEFFRVSVLSQLDRSSDSDSLLDWEERLLGTDLYTKDSDNDSMDDAFEFVHQFDPLNVTDATLDADSDLLSNATEYRLKLNPRLMDSNNNGISDALEDRDFDGLSNLAEIQTHGTDPTQPDTDDDGLFDGWEISNGYNPLVDNGTDADPNNNFDADPEGDGLVNYVEADHGSSTNFSDSDGNGISDAAEIQQGSDPSDPSSTQAPPGGVVPVMVTFGDPSGSHSEKYQVRLIAMEDAQMTFHRTNRKYGQTQIEIFRVPRGSKFKVELHHAGTDPELNMDKPDYDYQLDIEGAEIDPNVEVITDDESGILGEHGESDEFFGLSRIFSG